METKHTKGEWKIAYSKDGYPNGVETETSWICDTAFISLQDCEANAKLIAAAPELLEALTELVRGELFEQMLYHNAMSCGKSQLQHSFNRAVNAIKKATQ